jgi:hypothetical protein
MSHARWSLLLLRSIPNAIALCEFQGTPPLRPFVNVAPVMLATSHAPPAVVAVGARRRAAAT